MIPKLYQKDGTTLIGTLTNCIECLVEEERNGIFEVILEYPNNETISTSLVYDNIIICDSNDTLKDQKFRIYDTRRMMNNTIEVYARHISFDLAYDHINSIDITNQSCEYALNTIFRNSQFSTGYKGHSDIVNAQNYKISNCNALEAIAGKQGSIIDTYGTGAEILRDNTNIYVYNKRGNDNGVSIEYAKNLTGFELQENTDDLITRIIPFATYTPEGGQQTRVQGSTIDSQYINNYSHPFIAELDFSDKFEDNEVPTASKLQTLAEKYFNDNKCDLPKQNWKIEFIPLSKCVGYEGIEDAISLCDTVTIKDTRYNIDTKAKVIKTVYDVLRERYDSMELGEPRTTLGDIVNTGSEKGEQGPPGPQGPKGEDGNIGDFPDSVPAKPVLTTTLLGFASIQLDWTYENKPYYWYEVYASKTKDFTPNLFDIVHKGQTSSFLYQAKPGETWYFRVCGVNSYDHRSAFSDQIEVITTKVDDLSNYFTTAAIGNAVVGSLTADYMTTWILKGNWIDAKNLSVTDGNGKRTLDIDSYGNVNLDVTSLKIQSEDAATKSEVIQTSNQLVAKFTESGYNLLRNSEFKHNTAYWTASRFDTSNGGTSNHYKVDKATNSWGLHSYNVLCANVLYVPSSSNGKLMAAGYDSAAVDISPGESYSFSGYFAMQRCDKIRVELICYNANGTQVHNDGWEGQVSQSSYGNGTLSGYSYVTFTTTVPSNARTGIIRAYIYNYILNSENSCYMWMALPCLVKGSTPMKHSPNSNEVKDGIITLDGNGVSVAQNNSKTLLDSEALKFYSDDILYSMVKNGRLQFTTPDGIPVGFLGRATWTDATSYMNIVAAEYGQSVVLGTRRSSTDTGIESDYISTSINGVINNDLYCHTGANIIGGHIHGRLIFRPRSIYDYSNPPGEIYASDDGSMNIYGDNNIWFGINTDNKHYNFLKLVEDTGEANHGAIHSYAPLYMHGLPIYNAATTTTLNATSAQTYALRTLGVEEAYSDPTTSTVTNIYGVQSLTNGDVRWSDKQTYFTSEVEKGIYEAYVEIPWWLAQNIELDYHVNITCTNGFYQYYVSERDPYYFIVRSDKDSMGFTFEVVATLLEQNTLNNNASIAGEQYLSSEVDDGEQPNMSIPDSSDPAYIISQETNNNNDDEEGEVIV